VTVTAHPTHGTAAARGWLPSVSSGAVEVVWPLVLAVAVALGAWVLLPALLLGWRPVAVASGSMGPVLRPGHVVLVEPYRGQGIEPGAVVTYRDARLDRLVTHRVVAAAGDGTWRTRGDANAAEDPVPVTTDRVVGVGRLVVPLAGLPAVWLGAGRYELVVAAGAVTAWAAWGATRAATTRRRRYRRRRRVLRRRAALAVGSSVLVMALGGAAVGRAAFADARGSSANAFAATALAAPTGLGAVAGCGLLVVGPKVDLSWTGVAGATAYEVERRDPGAPGFAVLTTVAATTYTDTTVLGGSRTYAYRVRALRGGWSSDPSASASATTPLLCL